MNLTTLARVKRLAGIDTTRDDELIVETIEAVSALASRFMDREVQTATRTEYQSTYARQTVLGLKAWPVSSITSILYDPDGEFDGSEETLGAADEYQLVRNGETGMIRLRIGVGDYAQSLKITYVGGMASTTDAFCVAYPDVANAVTRQVVHEMQFRGAIGATSFGSGNAGSFSKTEGEELILSTRSVLARHQRRALL